MRITPAMRKKYPNHPHIRNPRRPGQRGPRPIGGPGKGRPPRKPRKLTTSEAAIRRFEQRKRGEGKGKPLPGIGPRRRGGHRGNDVTGGPRVVGRPWEGPAKGRPVGRGRRTTTQAAIARSESRRPKRTTSQAAIARFKAMRGRRRR